MRVLVIDNYDSFTYNLVQYLGELGADLVVHRNDQVTLDGIADGGRRPDRHLARARATRPTPASSSTRSGASGRGRPLLGVCLGHQAIGLAFGGRVVRAPVPGARQDVAGATTTARASSPGSRRRSRRLATTRSSCPPTGGRSALVVTARTNDGLVMGLRHREWPIHGVQFHPESILTGPGRQILRNFLHG